MSMISVVKKINDLRTSYAHKNGRAYKAKAVVCYKNMIVALLENGTIWTNWENMNRNCLCVGNWGDRQVQFFRCLVKLGLVTKAEVDEHMAHVATVTAERDVQSDRATLERLGKKYAFTPVPLFKPVKAEK